MNWIKSTWGALSTGFLVLLAAMAAAAALRQKNEADKWKDKAVDIELGNVVKGVESSKAASTQAKLHDNKAKALKKKAEARITSGAKHESTSDLLDKWRVS